jgi:hypothetical protein
MITVIAGALVIGTTTSIGAQAPQMSPSDKKAAKADATAKEITDLEHRWAQALMKKDVATLRTVLAPTYHDTDESGIASTLSDVESMVTSPDAHIEAINITSMNVAKYGKTAVATGTATQRGSYKGQPFAPRIVFTDTFVKLDGKWQAVASQRTAVH